MQTTDKSRVFSRVEMGRWYLNEIVCNILAIFSLHFLTPMPLYLTPLFLCTAAIHIPTIYINVVCIEVNFIHYYFNTIRWHANKYNKTLTNALFFEINILPYCLHTIYIISDPIGHSTPLLEVTDTVLLTVSTQNLPSLGSSVLSFSASLNTGILIGPLTSSL